MSVVAKALLLLAALAVLTRCTTTGSISENTHSTNRSTPVDRTTTPNEFAAKAHTGKVIHVLVALCDNVNQGIVPVPERLGNGDDLKNNLYWGAAFGVKAFFNQRTSDWRLLSSSLNPTEAILERCVFKHKSRDVYLIADAYRGKEIKACIKDFFDYAAGKKSEPVIERERQIQAGGAADLLAYVGHDGLMDFNLETFIDKQDDKRRDCVMLCCISKRYFAAPLRAAGAHPLLWTTGLMAPESYILRTAIDGWLAGEEGEQIRVRAAAAYHQYQRCGINAARNLFASGW